MNLILIAGYISGEIVDFTVNIFNKTSKDIKSCRVFIRKNVFYKSTSKTKYSFSNLEKIKYPTEISGNDFKTWKGMIKIPDGTEITIGSVNNSNIISITYDLLLLVKFGLFSFSKDVTIPLTFGTEMLDDSLQFED